MNYSTDSGLDLYILKDQDIPARSWGNKINLRIRCQVALPNEFRYTAYWLLPRSSLSKTPLRLSNSIGLIDCSYRGDLIAAVDNMSDECVTIKKGDRLFQLAAPDLRYPVTYTIVNKLTDTERGEGGFGSTGHH